MRLNRYAIVPCRFHVREKLFDSGKNHRFALVGAGEFFHRVHGIEAKQRNEFDFVAIFTDEQFGAAIAVDISRGNVWENFVAQHLFVRLCVRLLCPAVPDTRDHIYYCFLYWCS